MTTIAPTPPMGWRSWNLLGPNVNQSILEDIMEGMQRPAPYNDNDDGLALCRDLGYCNVGLDDNWQACDDSSAAPGMHYHDVKGKSIVNTQRFPNLKALTDKAHSLGLTAGWYHNNCICADHCRNESECELQIQQDARAIVEYGFDAVKLDGCGGQLNLTQFDAFLRHYSAQQHDRRRTRIEIENCHWGRDVPTQPDEYCPYAFYRTSGDIRPNYQSVMHNLQTVDHFHKRNLSRPGCWAYPDMLQVGVRLDYTGAQGLNEAETRSHFGAWAIVSSPLILSHDVNNETLTREIWHLIANREVLAVNQAYVGDSGGVFYASNETVQLQDIEGWQALPGDPNPPEKAPVVVPNHQYLSKRLSYDESKVAVLLMNSLDQSSQRLSLDFNAIPGITCTNGCIVRDIWKHQTLGVFTNRWSVAVGPHDAAFILLTSASASSQNFVNSLVPKLFILALILLLAVRMLARRRRLQYSQIDKGDAVHPPCVEMEDLPSHGHMA